MCCTVIEGQCKRCISDPWTVQSAAAGAYVKEIPRDLISHFNYCRQWRGSLAGALKLLLVFAIILCEFELCCYSFICSFSDHFLTISIQFVLHRVVEIHLVGEWHPSWSLGEQKVAREGDPSFCPLPRVASTRSCVCRTWRRGIFPLPAVVSHGYWEGQLFFLIQVGTCSFWQLLVLTRRQVDLRSRTR